MFTFILTYSDLFKSITFALNIFITDGLFGMEYSCMHVWQVLERLGPALAPCNQPTWDAYCPCTKPSKAKRTHGSGHIYRTTTIPLFHNLKAATCILSPPLLYVQYPQHQLVSIDHHLIRANAKEEQPRKHERTFSNCFGKICSKHDTHHQIC